MTAPEIKARLTMDDAASATLDKVRHGLGQVTSGVAAAQGAARQFFIGMAQNALGFQLSGTLDNFKGIAREAFAAAQAEQQTIRGLAGTVMMTDKLQGSVDGAWENAEELNRKLEEIGLSTNTSTDALAEMYSTLATRSTHGPERIVEDLREMAKVGKIVKGGFEGLAQGMSMVEMGMVRARNPVVMLVAATGLLHGNAREVAKQMQKMTPEQMVDVGERAIAAMSKRLAGGGGKASVKGAMFGMSELRTQVLEAAGTPFVEALGPPLNMLKKQLLAHRDDLEGFAGSLGQRVSTFMMESTTAAQKGFDLMKRHSDDIAAAWGVVKSSAAFLWEHRAMLVGMAALHTGMGMAPGIAASVGAAAGKAGAFGARIAGVGDIGMLLAGSGNGLFSLFKRGAGTPLLLTRVSNGFTALGGVMASFPLMLMNSAAGAQGYAAASAQLSAALGPAASGLGALALAVGGLSLAGWQLTELLNDMKQRTDDQLTGIEKLHEKVSRDGVGAINAIMTALETGLIDQKHADELRERAQWLTDQYNRIMMQATDAATNPEYGPEAAAIKLASAYNQAQILENEAAAKYTAEMLLRSGMTADALEDLGIKLEGGLEKFEQYFLGQGKKFREQLNWFTSGHVGGVDFKPPTNNITNHNTFHIQQDFRDQDPDRIALVFQRDVMRAADARRQSRLAGAFGY